MKRKIFSKALAVLFISSAISCAQVSAADNPKVPADRYITPGGADMYVTAPEPLTVAQCAQCHTGVFAKIQKDGKRHQNNCQSREKSLDKKPWYYVIRMFSLRPSKIAHWQPTCSGASVLTILH